MWSATFAVTTVFIIYKPCENFLRLRTYSLLRRYLDGWQGRRYVSDRIREIERRRIYETRGLSRSISHFIRDERRVVRVGNFGINFITSYVISRA